jgi:cytochrome c553
MKKILFLVFVILFAVGIAAAQTYTQGVGLTGIDILGAHQNGGRGCAGCHAPHSGGAGGGGNMATGTGGGGATNDPNSGSLALFGQDVTPLLGYSISFGNDNTSTGTGGPYVEILPAEGTAYTTQKAEMEGITMCLACHDGVVAKGQMMNGQSWEQRMNLLPTSVYGTHPIPTLLGNDSGNGNTSGYTNDHPVGIQATLAAAGVINANAPATGPLAITVTSAGVINTIVPNSTAYQAFNAAYGYPAIAGSIWDYGVAIQATDTTGATAFITCTTCHNQHQMYVYQGPPAYAGATAPKMASSQIGVGTYPTYFFINGPYNPGAGNNSATTANSTTQFCRQCHFDTANETFGIKGVTTQF